MAKKTKRAELKLRLPEPLRRRLETVAKRANISMNAEIIVRLEESFAHEDIRKQALAESLVRTVIERLEDSEIIKRGTILTGRKSSIEGEEK